MGGSGYPRCVHNSNEHKYCTTTTARSSILAATNLADNLHSCDCFLETGVEYVLGVGQLGKNECAL